MHALTPQPAPPSRRVPPREGQRAIVITASTGGIQALAQLIPALPPRVGAGTIVVQQLPEESFSAALADRLDRHSALEVKEAAGGEQLYAGTVLVAPGGSHLRLAGDRKVLVSTEAPIGGLRPRADLTIVDAARMFGESLLLVVLSGMGKDAVDGAAEVKRRGGRVLVESEASAGAYGTPRAVIEAQLADDVLMLDELPEAIVAEAGVWAPAGADTTVSAEQSYIQSLKAAGDTTRRLRGLIARPARLKSFGDGRGADRPRQGADARHDRRLRARRGGAAGARRGRAPRPRLGADRALPRSRAEPARRVVPAPRDQAARALRRRDVPARDRARRRDRRRVHPDARRPGRRLRRQGAALRRPDHEGQGAGSASSRRSTTSRTKVHKAIDNAKKGGAAKALGHAGAAVSLTKSIVNAIVATITILFLTFFMLLEGRDWVDSFYGLLPEASQPRWRKVGTDIYKAVGGYVVGNLVISVIAGVLATIVLVALGVPYAVALGLIVALLDLIPLAGRDARRDRRDADRRRHAGLGRGDRRRRVLPHLPAAREPPDPAGRLRADGAALAARRAHLGARRRRGGGDPRRARRDPGRGRRSR